MSAVNQFPFIPPDAVRLSSLSQSAQAVLEAIEYERTSAVEIERFTELPMFTVRRQLLRMLKLGYIKRTARGRYNVTNKVRDF